MQIIPLQAEDDIVSIGDRLDWAHDAQVIFVLPEDGGVLREGLDLVRLRRYADEMRVDVGLVTPDADISRQARAVGLPVFPTIGLARKNRRGWWRGRKRSELVGLPSNGDDRFADFRRLPRMSAPDKEEAHRRLSPPTTQRQWVLRYGAILLFFVVIALMYVAFIYSVPGATVTLKPESLPLRVEQSILADPVIEDVDYQRHLVPARILTMTSEWQAEVEPTGSIEVAEAPARGMVVFVNLLDQPVTIPAGTRVSTSDGRQLAYRTLNEASLPGVVNSTVEVEIIAEEPGPQGNVAAGLINQVEGSLAAQVEVRNLEPIEGGGTRPAKAVTAEDRERLRVQVLQYLKAAALAEMAGQVTERELLTPNSLRVVNILDETYSHDVGEQADRLSLFMRAEWAGTAVNTTEASGIAYEALTRLVPPDFALAPDSIRFESGEVTAVDEAGRVTFSMTAEGLAAAEVNPSEQIEAITGQMPDTAVAYLYQRLPLSEPPQITVWPTWFDRVPYTPARIQTEIEP